jgi:small subunit ribosomal protein S4
MGGYTGPVEKLERREGADLGLKGERALAGKTALQRRCALWPGQHGRNRRPRQSVYGAQLREAQKLEVIYGVREQQFRRYIQEARRRQDATTGGVLSSCSSAGSTTWCTGSAWRARAGRRVSS